jgi:hypothetical protein
MKAKSATRNQQDSNIKQLSIFGTKRKKKRVIIYIPIFRPDEPSALKKGNSITENHSF